MNFLKQFDIFYKGLVRDIKEKKINEADFYMIIKAKCKAMDRERREKMLLLNKEVIEAITGNQRPRK